MNCRKDSETTREQVGKAYVHVRICIYLCVCWGCMCISWGKNKLFLFNNAYNIVNIAITITEHF